jgi:sec-independent protein translocase protein TatB
MFDIGWMELLLIGIVALIVVGPKDLPKLFRNVGNFMGKARGMAREFQRSMEQAADESGLRDVSRDLDSINKLNLNAPTKSARKYAEGLVTGARKAKEGETDAPAPREPKAAAKGTPKAPAAGAAVEAPAAGAAVETPAAGGTGEAAARGPAVAPRAEAAAPGPSGEPDRG